MTDFDDLMRRLSSVTTKHKVRATQFSTFAGKIKSTIEGLSDNGICLREESKEKLVFTFLDTDFQFRLCHANASPNSRLVLERLETLVDGERKSHVVKYFFLDKSGNFLDAADGRAAFLAISDSNDVLEFFVKSLLTAAQEMPEEGLVNPG